MKKVIDGKAYNTDTAEYICDHDDPKGYAYFHGIEETLYRTARGALFLHVELGSQVHWESSVLGRWFRDHRDPRRAGFVGREIITTVTDEQAREFIQNHGDHEDFVKCFGEPEQA